MKKKNLHKPIDPTIIRVSTVSMSLRYLLPGQLGYLNQYYHIIGVSSPGPDLKFVKEKENISVYPVSISRKINIIKDLMSLISLIIIFRRIKPEIVHSITPKAGFLSMLAAFIAKTPIRMHTFTGLIFPSKKGLFKMLLAMIDRLTCFFATSVYPEGQGVNRDLLYYNITSKPLKILANGNINGIDINKFSKYSVKPESLNWLIEKYGITSKSFVFIFIGRLVGDKGINELITAFTIISETNPNIKLLLVGCLEPELDQLSTQTIKTIRKSPQIIEAGFQEDVLPYLNISDVLVFPSYREGFPNVVLQAGAMDLPCIVTDINGCNEIIIDGENGIIIPPKDADALYSAMESFLVNPELQEKLAKNAREMVVNRYEQSVVWEAIKGEYDYWLAKKGLL